MGRVGMNGGGSSVDLDVITTGAGDIVKGKVGVDKDGEPVTGTLALSGNATEAYVYNGKTFYSTDPKVKKTGGMTVNSLLSFSLAVISGRKVTASWGNPRQASGKPYSGVYIRYSTSGNPGKTGGTQIYKGAGSNTASGGTSTATFSLPNLNTKYYLSIYPYVTCSAGEMTGDVLNAVVTTGGEQTVTCTSSKNVTVPEGYTKADIFCVGGGSSGGKSSYRGGNAGFTKTTANISVTPGQILNVIVGAGGASNTSSSTSSLNKGSTSSVTRSGAELCSAAGGNQEDGKGGSGGASGAGYASREDGPYWPAGNAGSNGGDGTSHDSTKTPGKGQGTTTRAWGNSSGTLYAGGGGGGGAYKNETASAGGAGGGGRGGDAGPYYTYPGNPGSAGSANTGGGGGAGGHGGKSNDHGAGGAGGSGIVLIKFY